MDLAIGDDVIDATRTNGRVQVILNRGAAAPGSFNAPFALTTGVFPVGILAADLDGDAHVDLVSADRQSMQLSVFDAIGAGSFAPAVTYPVLGNAAHVVAAALRPGGAIDLVPSVGPVLLGDGAGGFSASTGAFAPGTFPAGIAAADLNRDAKMDLAIANAGTDHVTILLGDGAGGFAPSRTVPTGRYPGTVSVADMNGDGWPDLVVTRHMNAGIGANAVAVLLGLGAGEFGPPITVRDFLGLGIYDPPTAVADLNADGKPDLVVAGALGFSPTLLEVWLNATP